MLKVDKRLFYGTFLSCGLGLLLMIIGQALSWTIMGAFGMWIAIVNTFYIFYVIWAMRNGRIDDYRNILVLVHTYCLSGMTFSCTLGISAKGMGSMVLVGAILSIIGDSILAFILFLDEDFDLKLPLNENSKFKENDKKNKRYTTFSDAGSKRDTAMTEYSDFSELSALDNKTKNLNTEGIRNSEFSYLQDYNNGEEIATAKYDYEGSKDDPTELTFKKGDIFRVVITEKNWWKAINSNGKKGIVAGNYMTVNK
eukprot:NODE_201_length_15044_cov_0.334560.p5 type:complete len:254 gc:universal NODE_201_length_15044_cov_0.334560:14744-13983(-)